MGGHLGGQVERNAKSCVSSVVYCKGVLVKAIQSTDFEIDFFSLNVNWKV